jgi:hypothetical protein
MTGAVQTPLRVRGPAAVGSRSRRSGIAVLVAAGTVGTAVTVLPAAASVTFLVLLYALVVVAVLHLAGVRPHERPHAGVTPHQRAHAEPRRRVLVLVAAVLVVLATNVVVLGPRWLPYVLAGVVLLAVVAGRRTGGRVTGDTAMVPLAIWGLVGSVYGRFVLGYEDNPLAFFFPVLVALVHLWRPLPVYEVSHVRFLSRVLVLASCAYLAVAHAVLVQGWDVLPVRDFKHETLHFVAMALVGAAVLRRRIVLGFAALLAAIQFLAYPALTWVVVASATAALCASTAGRRVGPLMVGVLATTAAALLVFTSISLGELRARYFAAVGKVDNTSTRETLLRTGLARYLESPVFGSSMTENIAVPSRVTGVSRLVPVHNDYFQMAISGGAVAAALLVFWAIATVAMSVRLVRRFRQLRMPEHAHLALIAATGVVGVLVTASFNPVLFDTRTSLLLGLLHLVLASLNRVSGSIPAEVRA